MRSSCIRHPENEPLIVIRRWQLEFCEGNLTAAAMLSYFEYWHNIKLELARKNQEVNQRLETLGYKERHDTGLLQFHSAKKISEGIFGIGGKTSVHAAKKFLISKGVISVHKKVDKRTGFDNQNHYLFHPKPLQTFIEMGVSSKMNQPRPNLNAYQFKNEPYTETTYEDYYEEI